jgi:hypothetical protein
MAKNQSNDDGTVVNYASPGSVVGIQCGAISDTTIVVNGGGRWLDDPADMNRDLIDDLDD